MMAEFRLLPGTDQIRRVVVALVKEQGGIVKVPADLVNSILPGTTLELGMNMQKGFYLMRITEKTGGGIII